VKPAGIGKIKAVPEPLELIATVQEKMEREGNSRGMG